MEEEKSFLGRGWSFPPTFNKTSGALEMVENEEDIRQSLIIFLTTRRGERLMRPKYGSTLDEQLFSSARADVLNALAEELKMAIRLNEPRVIVNAVKIDPSGVPDGRILIEVDYTVEATNVRNNLVYPFYLIEGTHI
jgi:phage baseplate assembly protein W